MRSHSALPSVFPTPVGVFLCVCGLVAHFTRLPHACGGVSAMDLHGVHAATVFPTPVGVFPPWPCHVIHGASLPHACGGVSTSSHRYAVNDWSSPRLWGCFPPPCLPIDKASVFPTPVGVFPTPAQTPTAGPSLPHACVGVFPVRSHRSERPTRLPHACGGVSASPWRSTSARWSSPRLWGCFCVAVAAPAH